MPSKQSKKELQSVRLDKWLWAARFFKTRANAVEAVNGGKVHLNDLRVKPSRNIKIGDELTITRDNFKYTVTVIALNDKRRPAKEAQLLYEESKDSIKAREQERDLRKMTNANMRSSDKKPNKKERRQMDKWRGR